MLQTLLQASSKSQNSIPSLLLKRAFAEGIATSAKGSTEDREPKKPTKMSM